jgi:hypothetical protein
VLELIHHISAREGIKVYVASRQWTEFNNAFYENLMLRMQGLATADMAHLVEFKFERNRGFLELKKIFLIGSCLETARHLQDCNRPS